MLACGMRDSAACTVAALSQYHPIVACTRRARPESHGHLLTCKPTATLWREQGDGWSGAVWQVIDPAQIRQQQQQQMKGGIHPG